MTKYVTHFKEDGSGEFEDEKIRVQDITGVVSLTLFDRDVTKLIQKTAREVLDDLNEEDDFGKYPAEINHLLEKKFAYKIEVSDFNLKNNYQVYGILKLTDDSSVISELDKMFNIIQPNESDSVNLTMSEFQSQDTVAMKVMSFFEDNSTPTLFTNVKRKLIEVYDLDEHSSVRSKKSYNW
ncbi:hypothetical protein R6Q57_026551 [Mikania cordata]